VQSKTNTLTGLDRVASTTTTMVSLTISSGGFTPEFHLVTGPCCGTNDTPEFCRAIKIKSCLVLSVGSVIAGSLVVGPSVELLVFVEFLQTGERKTKTLVKVVNYAFSFSLFGPKTIFATLKTAHKFRQLKYVR
jgi:hypothetical protein